MPDIFKAIVEEMDAQDEKWGSQRELPDYVWLAILMEEVGEAAEAILKQEIVELEIIQIAAVACQWLDAKSR